MPVITTQVKIAASPETVRAKFLEFSQIPNYAPKSFIHSITPAIPKNPSEIQAGDVLNCVLGNGSMKFSPVVLENSPSVFCWRGSIPGIFVGDHAFRFEELKTTESGTKGTLFVQEEKFSGILSFLMGDGLLAKWAGQTEKTKRGFEGFNRDIKTWIEK